MVAPPQDAYPPKKPGNPLVKICGGCCLAMIVFIVIGAVVSYGWLNTLISIEPSKTTAVFEEISGAKLPAGYTSRLSVDMQTFLGVKLAVAHAPQAQDLALVAYSFAPSTSKNEQKEAIAATNLWFLESLKQSGQFPPALDVKRHVRNGLDTVCASVGGKDVDVQEERSAHDSGVQTVRYRIPLAGGRVLIAAGNEDSFDFEALKAILAQQKAAPGSESKGGLRRLGVKAPDASGKTATKTEAPAKTSEDAGSGGDAGSGE